MPTGEQAGPDGTPPKAINIYIYSHVALVFSQLRAAPFYQEPAAPAGYLCSCIADGLKNRSALRSFIEGAYCLYYNFKSNLKQRKEVERSTHMRATIGAMRTMMTGWGLVVHDGGWWCVEGGGGVCGQSSQACFHAASIEMDI